MECGFRCDGDDNVDGEGNLSLRGLGCVVVRKGAFFFSDEGNPLIVTNGLEPLWRSEVFNFGDPDFFTEAANGCMEWRKPGGKV